jgi:hypothetical protein
MTRGTNRADSASKAATPKKKKPEPPPADDSTPVPNGDPAGAGPGEPGADTGVRALLPASPEPLLAGNRNRFPIAAASEETPDARSEEAAKIGSDAKPTAPCVAGRPGAGIAASGHVTAACEVAASGVRASGAAEAGAVTTPLTGPEEVNVATLLARGRPATGTVYVNGTIACVTVVSPCVSVKSAPVPELTTAVALGTEPSTDVTMCPTVTTEPVSGTTEPVSGDNTCVTGPRPWVSVPIAGPASVSGAVTVAIALGTASTSAATAVGSTPATVSTVTGSDPMTVATVIGSDRTTVATAAGSAPSPVAMVVGSEPTTVATEAGSNPTTDVPAAEKYLTMTTTALATGIATAGTAWTSVAVPAPSTSANGVAIPAAVVAAIPTPPTTVGVTDVITVPGDAVPSAPPNVPGYPRPCVSRPSGFTVGMGSVFRPLATVETRPDPAVNATAGSIGSSPVVEE